jgi:hypothetical protein
VIVPKQGSQLFGRFAMDLASFELWWSESMLDIHGVGWDNPVDAARVLSHVHDEERATVRDVLDQVRRTPGPVCGQYRFVTDEGLEKVIAFAGDVEDVETAPRPRRLVGYAIDITDEARRAGTRAVRAAVHNRKAIEQVKGALMATYGLDEAAAFDVLVDHSSRYNIKLAALSAGVADRLGSQLRESHDIRSALLKVIEEVAGGQSSPGPTTPLWEAAGEPAAEASDAG